MGRGLLKLQPTRKLLKMEYSPELLDELRCRHSVGGCTGARCALCKKIAALREIYTKEIARA